MARQSRAIRMTDEEWAVVKKVAAEEGLSASEYVRRAIAKTSPEFGRLLPHTCYICGRKYPRQRRYWQKWGGYVICNECAEKLGEVELSRAREAEKSPVKLSSDETTVPENRATVQSWKRAEGREEWAS